MRTLSSTLSAAQKKNNLTPLYKIVLTYLSYTYTYDRSRIVSIDPHDEQSYSQKATVVLDNSDNALTIMDLKGYEAVISYGCITPEGEEYSACAPLTVLSQEFDSQPGELVCTLELIGIPDLMAEDHASESYVADDNVKNILTKIANATLACYTHCTAYEIVFDSEDTLITTYYPGVSFRIHTNGPRLAAIRRLLDFTGCSMIVKADGKIHVFVPTTSGTTYDCEYSLSPGSHTFLAKTYENRLAVPNYIMVKSFDDDDPQYAGVASDAAVKTFYEFRQMKLESNEQGMNIARAIVDKARIQAKGGSGTVPLNLAAEILDYVQIIDSREGDTRTGNIGYIRRRVNAKKKIWQMIFGFGGWKSYRGLLNDLETYSDAGAYFERLSVQKLYAENIQVENLDIVWIDNDGNIDLSKIGDTLDNLPDGEVYARVKSVHLDVGGLVIDDACIYKSGYDPSGKEKQVTKFSTAPSDPTTGDLWLDTSVTPNVLKRWNGTAWVNASPTNLDELPNGTVYSRLKSASLSAEGLVLLDQVSVGSVYGLVNKTDISAGHILLSTTETDSTHRLVTDDEKSTWGSKNKTFYQNDAPTTGMATGDLWFDTNDDYKAYRYSGSAWVTVQDGEITELRTDIDSGNIKLTSLTTASGEWYDKSGVEIDANSGINIYGTNNAFTTRAEKTGTIQCYVGSDGAIYAGAGAVILNASGLKINGNYFILADSSGTQRGLCYGDTEFVLSASTNINLKLSVGGTGFIYPNGLVNFGYNSSGRIRLPVGTNKY